MTRVSNAIKTFISIIIILSVSVFFYKTFQRNWSSIQLHRFEINYVFLSSSFITILSTYLISTYGWYITINSISNRNDLSFSQSIAIVNASNLTKYIPGKIWSFSLQMYWLANIGYSKALILYVNIINIIISIITTIIVGLAYLLYSPNRFPFAATLALLLIFILIDICFIEFNSVIFNRIIMLLNKILKCNIKHFDVTKKLLLHLHVIHIGAAFILGVGAYLLCLGIGFHIEPGKILLVMSSLLLSDVIGFLAVIVPGGLGVREGFMYMMLGGALSGSLSLILPIASRIVNMLVDIFLGVIALKLMRNFINEGYIKT
ncbi:MAG: hypothetical protein P4L44_10585 [Oryzomonas sp.]|uniref:hypothetical protein n=1 Tax=Oryzomonas sp. TaxID=2855186 RepID=UPI00284A0A43|nr:hypothetical protein [Oryzomonas sp.]MDR3580398.1 hypothetical protein [Oryzomonas sp.]